MKIFELAGRFWNLEPQRIFACCLLILFGLAGYWAESYSWERGSMWLSVDFLGCCMLIALARTASEEPILEDSSTRKKIELQTVFVAVTFFVLIASASMALLASVFPDHTSVEKVGAAAAVLLGIALVGAIFGVVRALRRWS